MPDDGSMEPYRVVERIRETQVVGSQGSPEVEDRVAILMNGGRDPKDEVRTYTDERDDFLKRAGF